MRVLIIYLLLNFLQTIAGKSFIHANLGIIFAHLSCKTNATILSPLYFFCLYIIIIIISSDVSSQCKKFKYISSLQIQERKKRNLSI